MFKLEQRRRHPARARSCACSNPGDYLNVVAIGPQHPRQDATTWPSTSSIVDETILYDQAVPDIVISIMRDVTDREEMRKPAIAELRRQTVEITDKVIDKADARGAGDRLAAGRDDRRNQDRPHTS